MNPCSLNQVYQWAFGSMLCLELVGFPVRVDVELCKKELEVSVRHVTVLVS